MEETNKTKEVTFNDKQILYSKAIKAGKRIYYLDVKQSRRKDLFLAITESKRIMNGEGENLKISFEKHKIFLYKEDFDKFTDALNEALEFIKDNQVEQEPAQVVHNEEANTQQSTGSNSFVDNELNDGAIKIDIDF